MASAHVKSRAHRVQHNADDLLRPTAAQNIPPAKYTSPPLLVAAHRSIAKAKHRPPLDTIRTYWRALIGTFLAYDSLGFPLALVVSALADAIICAYMLKRVEYTNIDWTAYMEQVSIYVGGERNYFKIRGDTGPLVYPAGHLMIFRALYWLTNKGANVQLAQFIFTGFYAATQGLVYWLFFRSGLIGGGVLVLMLSLSYRLHSIFILRLFNDPIAMLIFYCAAVAMTYKQFAIACFLYSVAVSVKMNILLFAPAVFCILLLSTGLRKTIACLTICALVQLGMGAQFLAHDPLAYVGRAFELGRVFQYRWSVNWQFISETIFLATNFHLMLLLAHIVLLCTFAFTTWFRRHGGLLNCLIEQAKFGRLYDLSVHEILHALFTANLAGIVVARSIHYQFYSWYYHALFYLLYSSYDFSLQAPKFNMFKTKFAVWIAMSFVLAGIEIVYNVYPPHAVTSLLLFVEHMGIVGWLVYAGRTTFAQHAKVE